MSNLVVLRTSISGYNRRSGKVRDVYDLGTSLVIVATDRVSAFDRVFPNGIAGKGCLLTSLSSWWLRKLNVSSHLLSEELDKMPPDFRHDELRGRTQLVLKCKMVAVECVVRGFLCGGAWKEYQTTGGLWGQPLPRGLQENQQFLDPIFTPTTKEDDHDRPLTYEALVDMVGESRAASLRAKSINIYQSARHHCWERGLLLADTKLEWGANSDNILLLCDEVLTPDSSRYWGMEEYRLGGPIHSLDKQYIRDWLMSTGWDAKSPLPEIPPEVELKTLEKYQELYKRLTS